ncbi:hypothetical protein Metme_4486 [Methylomonas methanica MC09]|uniref:Uncharacterized protein n=1 Tax=Methylomonas methanica (strain DSM 25384 / MC09) TaxID=857087 RepID=G0A4T5_METMM|nr:hypothetical protein Metme_4486 [Methylomonas methanica MC09]
MSGSNGSSGVGNGFWESEESCETLVIDTQLSSPKPDVISDISVGDLLDISAQPIGTTTVVVALYQGKVAGGLASPKTRRLLECLAGGTRYVARVTEKNDGQIRVRVSPQ